MPKPKNTTNRTYICQGRLHRKTKAHEILKERRITAGILFDAALEELATAHQGKTLDGNDAQLLATAVARKLGAQRGPLRQRCRIATVSKAVNAWNNHIKHERGAPRKYNGEPVRTIQTYANNKRMENPLVTINNAGNATLRFPNLPPIRLYSCRPLPDDQPTYASVSVKDRQIQVSLVYRTGQEPLPPKDEWDPCAVLGLDRGIAELIATSAGISHEGISQKKLQERIKKAAQLKQAMVRKAARAGLAGYRAVVDENNRQVLTEKGKPRRYLHWTKGTPTKEYRKAAKCLSRLLRQRTQQRKAYRHQVAAQIIKHCVKNGLQLIALEELEIPNMTKSARGTLEKPGRRVAQKSSLNRRILEQGWAELAGFIRYKARYQGIRVVEVHAAGTSQTCSLCGHRDRKSRKGRRFQCISCGHQADADHNAAVNIGDRGTYIYLKRTGASLEEIRQQRLDRADRGTTGRQEPVTGLDDAPKAHPTGLSGFRPSASPIQQPDPTKTWGNANLISQSSK